MKKKFLIAIFMTFLTLNSAVYATNQYNHKIDGERICFAEDLMKEIVKETINSVGKQLLDKYLGPNNMNYSQNNNNSSKTNNNNYSNNNNSNNNNSNAASNANNNNYQNDNNSTASNNSTVENSGISVYEEEEEMIIIE